ncbi:uncharacterized protein EDB91DRAFT_1058349 [Suillus paluster]|uniref:uncharacterized protein n=1 Tax=Suillus paluster TaxID=48578 RepID=UPI001B870FBE|nr:uncharacterized protein EDB91DRAFT_1058349 [Suillus paluster]KAG1732024.1 hypothetical protein EDB91DRAFT_1058349 [Suillus paluster]
MKDALSNIRDESTPPGNIKAVLALQNGGIIVELENEDLATWLRGTAGRALLEGQFDSAVSFCTRTFPIVLEYLPIQLQIESDGFLHKIEHDNQLSKNVLVAIRWIKPPL